MKAAEAASERIPARRGGRPTRSEAEQIRQRIIDTAGQLFSERSVDAISVDLIAARAQISKRTFYSRFASKEELFAAVVRHGSETMLTSLDGERGAGESVEHLLTRVGLQLTRLALSPRSTLVLNRLILGEAQGSPHLTRAVYDNAILRTRDRVAALLAECLPRTERSLSDLQFLAEQFMHAVVDGPARLMVLSGRASPSEAELTDQVARAVGLFLRGARAF